MFLVVLYSILGIALAAWQGQDLNWDLLNYHFYNQYMLLNGRITQDVHAAGVQSFYNPLADLPFYAAVRFDINPMLFFILSGIPGLAALFPAKNFFDDRFSLKTALQLVFSRSIGSPHKRWSEKCLFTTADLRLCSSFFPPWAYNTCFVGRVMCTTRLVRLNGN